MKDLSSMPAGDGKENADSILRNGDSCFKPRLTQLLRTLGLDIVFERGQGNCLYYRDAHGQEIEVLDLIGGYGSLLLGHSHPMLTAEAHRFLSSGQPIHVQGSLHECSRRLACELSRRAGGGYCAVFANTGAEAVEAAIKHAILETGSRTFVALERAFHGQTLGALQLTADEQYRGSFQLSGLKVMHVASNDLAQLEQSFARTDDLAGLIFEPIQGEGGIRPVSRTYAQRMAHLCAERNIPLIADECQTGLGRTGTFLACESLGVKPDYILLSKALGGGLAKISALLIRRERYVEDFDLKHTSTYADDDYSSAIALKTLEIIDDALLANCRAKGERLLTGLRRIWQAFPDVIADVRGEGLMVGIEFRPQPSSSSFVLRFLSSQRDLALLVAGYLMHVHRLRAAPTLGDRFTLRLEPSALIEEADLDRVVAAIEDVCVRMRQDDAVALTGPSLNGSSTREEPQFVRSDGRFFAYRETRFREVENQWSGVRVAWLFHLIDGEDLARLDCQFGRLSSERREEFLHHFVGLAGPVLMSAVDVQSMTGAKVRLYPILLPFTSRWVKRLIDEHRLSLPQALVQQGVDLAHSLGCQVVSLGQYTSIVTVNGTRLFPHGMGVTTGNTFSISLACSAIEHALGERGCEPEKSTLAIVGAAGNIGRTCAEILAPQYRHVILIGSQKPGSQARLRGLARTIPNAEMSVDLSTVRDGNVVITAVNCVDAPLGPTHFAHEAIVCDVSIPAGVQPGTAAARPDLCVIGGGIARLPFDEDLEITGFPLPSGQIYGCTAEALLLGFEGMRGVSFTGPLTAAHVHRISEMARRHGFHLADFKRVLA